MEAMHFWTSESSARTGHDQVSDEEIKIQGKLFSLIVLKFIYLMSWRDSTCVYVCISICTHAHKLWCECGGQRITERS